MTTLASADDLRVHIRDPNLDDSEAELALESASAMARSYCRWDIAPPFTETVILDSDGGEIIQLPALKVTDVATVLVDGVALDPTTWTWSEAGMLYRRMEHWQPWQHGCTLGGFPRGFRRVSVTFTGGYDTPPDDVRAVVLSVAGRHCTNPAGFVSETFGGYAYQWPFVRSGPMAGTVAGGTLTVDETRVLDRYRIAIAP